MYHLTLIKFLNRDILMIMFLMQFSFIVDKPIEKVINVYLQLCQLQISISMQFLTKTVIDFIIIIAVGCGLSFLCFNFFRRLVSQKVSYHKNALFDFFYVDYVGKDT